MVEHWTDNRQRGGAIAKQAEAARLRRARVIVAEMHVSEKLHQAGQMLAKQQEAMQPREFSALLNIAGEKISTIIFPLPAGLMTLRASQRSKGAE